MSKLKLWMEGMMSKAKLNLVKNMSWTIQKLERTKIQQLMLLLWCPQVIPRCLLCQGAQVPCLPQRMILVPRHCNYSKENCWLTENFTVLLTNSFTYQPFTFFNPIFTHTYKVTNNKVVIKFKGFGTFHLCLTFTILSCSETTFADCDKRFKDENDLWKSSLKPDFAKSDEDLSSLSMRQSSTSPCSWPW